MFRRLARFVTRRNRMSPEEIALAIRVASYNDTLYRLIYAGAQTDAEIIAMKGNRTSSQVLQITGDDVFVLLLTVTEDL
jgi:hypothetical protein